MKSNPLVSFFARGRAVSQPRAQQGNRGVKIMAPRTHAIHGWRDVLKLMAQQAMNGRLPVSGPIRLELLFLFARPKRLCRPRGVELKDGERYIDELALHESDPDWDNIGKAVSDAFRMVVWLDDCQVSTVSLRKRYANHAEPPGVLVRAYRDAVPW